MYARMASDPGFYPDLASKKKKRRKSQEDERG